MKRTGRKREWSLVLFCVGVLMFFPPILGIVNQTTIVLGVPAAFLFLFGMWALIIVLIAIGARRQNEDHIPEVEETQNRTPSS